MVCFPSNSLGWRCGLFVSGYQSEIASGVRKGHVSSFFTLEPHLVTTPESPVHGASVFVSTNAHWSGWFRRPCCLVISHPIFSYTHLTFSHKLLPDPQPTIVCHQMKLHILTELHQIKMLVKRVSWKNPNNPSSFQHRLLSTNWLVKPYCQRQYPHNSLKIKVGMVPTKNLQPCVLAFFVKECIAYTIKGEKTANPQVLSFISTSCL